MLNIIAIIIALVAMMFAGLSGNIALVIMNGFLIIMNVMFLTAKYRS